MLKQQAEAVEKNLDIAFTAADNAVGRQRTVCAGKDNE